MSRHRAQPDAADDRGAGRHRAAPESDATSATATALAVEPAGGLQAGSVAYPDVATSSEVEIAARAPRSRHRAGTRARPKPGATGTHRHAARRRMLPVLTPRVVLGGAVASTLTVVSAATVTTGPAGSTPDATGQAVAASTSGASASTSRADGRVSRADRTAVAGSVADARAASTGAVTAGFGAEAVVTWALPVAAPNVSSCFGYRGGENHQGADLPKPLGTPIYAVGAGRVVAAGPASGFGYRVVIEHADGVTSTYGHMRYWNVEVGQQVAAGQQIAVVGNEGQSTGPHVHVEIRTQGQTVDPSTFLRARGVELGSP